MRIMSNPGRKDHWEQIYRTKTPEEFSWFQSVPGTSLELIEELKLPLDARIIDIGGGDSLLVDHLLQQGFRQISVLDISEAALERAKKRLGSSAEKVEWIISDVTDFRPAETYDLWHDRATFHFLTREQEINDYVRIAAEALPANRRMLIGTFSEQGPEKCSGKSVSQYSESALAGRFSRYFRQIDSFVENHTTPSGAVQQFVFGSFERK